MSTPIDKKPPEPRRPPRRDPMDALIRTERAIRKLPPDAACIECGETNPNLLELDHPAGEVNDPALVVVRCLNHHRIHTVNQTAIGVDLKDGPDRTTMDRLISWLRGLALMFSSLAKSCREWADRLAAVVEGLDAKYPEWRDLPETDQ